jgi:hypothetical protein
LKKRKQKWSGVLHHHLLLDLLYSNGILLVPNLIWHQDNILQGPWAVFNLSS